MKIENAAIIILILIAAGVLVMMLSGNTDLILCGHHYVNGHC